MVCKKIKGFTLVEAVIAISVFSVAALLSIQAIIGSLRYNRDLEAWEQGLKVARNHVELIRSLNAPSIYTNKDHEDNPNVLITLPNGELIAPGVWHDANMVEDPETGEETELLPGSNLRVKVDVYEAEDPMNGGNNGGEIVTAEMKDIIVTVRFENPQNETRELHLETRVTTWA